MKTIKIISGSYGADNGSGGVKLVSRGETCVVDEGEAARLVSLGVAAVDVATLAGAQEISETSANTSDDGNGPSEQETALFDEAKLLTMTNDDLKKLGESMGADVAKCKKKADYVAAIIAAQEVVDEGEDEDPPYLSVEDPV